MALSHTRHSHNYITADSPEASELKKLNAEINEIQAKLNEAAALRKRGELSRVHYDVESDGLTMNLDYAIQRRQLILDGLNGMKKQGFASRVASRLFGRKSS